MRCWTTRTIASACTTMRESMAHVWRGALLIRSVIELVLAISHRSLPAMLLIHAQAILPNHLLIAADSTPMAGSAVSTTTTAQSQVKIRPSSTLPLVCGIMCTPLGSVAKKLKAHSATMSFGTRLRQKTTGIQFTLARGPKVNLEPLVPTMFNLVTMIRWPPWSLRDQLLLETQALSSLSTLVSSAMVSQVLSEDLWQGMPISTSLWISRSCQSYSHPRSLSKSSTKKTTWEVASSSTTRTLTSLHASLSRSASTLSLVLAHSKSNSIEKTDALFAFVQNTFRFINLMLICLSSLFCSFSHVYALFHSYFCINLK